MFDDDFENEAFENIEGCRKFTAASKNNNFKEISQAKLKSQMYSVISKYTGLYNDNAWQAINKLVKDLQGILPDITIIDSKYEHDEFGNPNGKRWWYCGIITEKGKPRVVVIELCASGAGSVKNPLDKYDITALVNVLAPSKIKDPDIRDYINQYGLEE